MRKPPQVRAPGGWSAPSHCPTDQVGDVHARDLQTLREIVAGLDRLEERLDRSEIPQAVAQRGYFTPDEDDRVRQGVLAYRNYRLAAYEIIFRYRDYASLAPRPFQLQGFLLAFAAALELYAKSLKIIAFAEHVPALRAKINEPDMKYELQAGLFDDLVACYSQPSNYRAIRQADRFWRMHRREAQAVVREAGGDWIWLVDLIRRQRRVVGRRLFHVLMQRLRYDWRAFVRTVIFPFRQARRGLESLLGDRLADARVTSHTACAVTQEVLSALRPQLQPGDVLLMRNDSRLTAAIIPGFWCHTALYLGGSSELERLGARSHPHVARHWPEIPQAAEPSGLVIEAVFPAVKLNPLETCLQVDHLLVLRPALPPNDIAAALAEAMGHLGKPYDFEFDFNNTSRIVCTELVYRSYHKRGTISFTLTKRLGRFTLTGDDIVAQVLDGSVAGEGGRDCGLHPVALVLKRRDGQPHLAPSPCIRPWLRRLRRGWRPTRRVKSGRLAAGSGVDASATGVAAGGCGNELPAQGRF